MKQIEDAISRLVRAGLETRQVQKSYLKMGLDDNPIFQIWGDIVESIYTIIGEQTETIEQSVTYLAMTAPILTEERRVKMLMAEFRKNYPEMPELTPFRPETLKATVLKNGGYCRETGYVAPQLKTVLETPEGEWS